MNVQPDTYRKECITCGTDDVRTLAVENGYGHHVCKCNRCETVFSVKKEERTDRYDS
jgi:transcription elongation factor Elf1